MIQFNKIFIQLENQVIVNQITTKVVWRVTEELEGVPNFMTSLISQLVGGLVKKKGVDVGVQTE